MIAVGVVRGVTLIKVTGDVDERFQPSAQQLAAIKPGPIEIDCTAIGMINSIGTRNWINFLRALAPKGPYSFRGCHDNFLAYARMVPLFTNNAKVLSFYVPFECTSCDARTEVLHETRAVVEIERLFQPVPCKACGAETEPAADAEEYERVLGTAT
jgi:hypothetical protein